MCRSLTAALTPSLSSLFFRRSKLQRLRNYVTKRACAFVFSQDVTYKSILAARRGKSRLRVSVSLIKGGARSEPDGKDVQESGQRCLKRSLPHTEAGTKRARDASMSAASTPTPKVRHVEEERPHQKSSSSADAAALREKLQIRIEEDPFKDCPAPMSSFEEDDSLPKYVLASLKSRGITSPMPIQAQALPLVRLGRDVIGLAQTGSGKTLAFLLPAAVHLQALPAPKNGRASGPNVLVLAPTRELAVQIADEADKIFEHSGREAPQNTGIQTACLYGGGDKWRQQQKVRQGAQIVVATPGRLLDFVNTGVLDLSRVNYFALDEADRMLDMGFNEDVTTIAGHTMPKRQVLFFSATWNSEVQVLAQGLCSKDSKPVRISYGQGDKIASDGGDAAKHQAREGIVQEVHVVDCKGEDWGADSRWDRQAEQKDKILDKHLKSVLEASKEHKVLVFVSQKAKADELSGKLKKLGFAADAMHGGKAQDYRLWVLDQFRKGHLQVLVCTDVLGRGIDIPKVSHVVIYEMGEIEDYVHRIGRTARGRYGKGHALVFFEYYEGAPQSASDLIGVLGASKQSVPDALRRMADEVARGQRTVRAQLKKW